MNARRTIGWAVGGLCLLAALPAAAEAQMRQTGGTYRAPVPNAISIGIPPGVPRQAFKQAFGRQYLGVTIPLYSGAMQYGYNSPYYGYGSGYGYGLGYLYSGYPYYGSYPAFGYWYSGDYPYYGGYPYSGAYPNYAAYTGPYYVDNYGPEDFGAGFLYYNPEFAGADYYAPTSYEAAAVVSAAAAQQPTGPSVLNLATPGDPKDDPKTAVVMVQAPDGAQVSVDGKAFENKPGAVRRVVSPPLDPAKTYTYDIRATWKGADGKTIDRTQQVDVRAGSRQTVTFLNVPGEK
jgi:uncharacterized protein (TIGR03000 family)